MIAPEIGLLAGRLAELASGRLHGMAAGAIAPATLAGLGGMALVLSIEVIALGYGRSSVWRFLHPTAATKQDLFFFLGRWLGYGNLVVLAFSLGIPALAIKLASKIGGLGLLSHVESLVLRAAIFLIVTDFFAYWTHRGRHAFAWWWELHKYHHAAEEFNAITTARRHPLDVAAILVANALPAALLGGSVDDYLLLAVVLGVHAGLSHSMLDWRWGWFGKYVLFAPTGHRIHHSPLREHMDKNFGSLFPVWDWMFGTLYTGDVLNEEVGVDDNCYAGRGLWENLVLCTRRAARAAFGASPATGAARIG